MSLPFPQIDPVALDLGFFQLRWYALSYIAGFGLAWGWMRLLNRGGPRPPSPHDIDDAISYGAFGAIIGGRLGYCLIYNPSHYLSNPLDILKLWEGGMASHGGMLGVIVALFLLARARSIPFLRLSDLAAAGTPIGLLLGRIANFINGELWGRPTTASWGMQFPGDLDQLPRHPSQLYQAGMEGLLLFIVLAVLWRRGALNHPGTLSGSFLALYGVLRCIGETFREPDAQLGFLWGGATMGQLLSIPLIMIGAWMVWRARRDPPVPELGVKATNDDPDDGPQSAA